MLRLQNIRRLSFQCFHNAADTFQARACLPNASDGRAELLNGRLPEPAVIEREDPYAGSASPQRLDSVKELPLRSTLTERSGKITNLQLRKIEHRNLNRKLEAAEIGKP